MNILPGVILVNKASQALKLLMLGIFAVALVACSGSKRRLAAELTPVKSTMEMKQVWSKSLSGSDTLTFRPVAVSDDIYVSSVSGDLMRLDAASGQVTWKVNIGSDLSTGPGTDGRVIAVANGKGMVFAYDSNGGKLWQESVGTEVLTEPLVAGGVVVVRTIDNRMIALDLATGKRRWTYQRGQSPLSLRTSYGMISINNEVLMTGFSGGKFGIVALANGNLIWDVTLSTPRGFSEIERLSDIAAKPSILGQQMCAVSYQGKIGCGDAKTVTMTWAKDFSSFTGIAQTQDKIFSSNDKSHIYAFKSSNGAEVWRNESLTWRDVGEPLAVGKLLFVGDGQGYLHILSQDSGDFLGRIRVDSSRIVAAPLAVAGVIVVQTRGGTLAAYRPN